MYNMRNKGPVRPVCLCPPAAVLFSDSERRGPSRYIGNLKSAASRRRYSLGLPANGSIFENSYPATLRRAVAAEPTPSAAGICPRFCALEEPIARLHKTGEKQQVRLNSDPPPMADMHRATHSLQSTCDGPVQNAQRWCGNQKTQKTPCFQAVFRPESPEKTTKSNTVSAIPTLRTPNSALRTPSFNVSRETFSPSTRSPRLRLRCTAPPQVPGSAAGARLRRRSTVPPQEHSIRRRCTAPPQQHGHGYARSAPVMAVKLKPHADQRIIRH